MAAAIPGLLGWWAAGVRVGLIAVFAVVLAAASVYWYGERIVAGLVGAEELPRGELPVLRSTVERLAARSGIAPPKVYIVRDGFPRAWAAGRGPVGSAVGVSQGLIQALPPAELDGVLAHEIAHIRTRDVLVATPAVVVAAALVELSRVGGLASRALLFVLGPLASAIVNALLSPKREFTADALAAFVCESPHGLAAALLRLEQAIELVELRANPATAPLYTLDPFPDRGLPALFATQPPPGERIAGLRALDPEWRERVRAA